MNVIISDTTVKRTVRYVLRSTLCSALCPYVVVHGTSIEDYMLLVLTGYEYLVAQRDHHLWITCHERAHQCGTSDQDVRVLLSTPSSSALCPYIVVPCTSIED